MTKLNTSRVLGKLYLSGCNQIHDEVLGEVSFNAREHVEGEQITENGLQISVTGVDVVEKPDPTKKPNKDI